LQVPRPPAAGAGRVFLAFFELPAAVLAFAALDGRRFGESTVVAK
jgi:hypothetical protein